MVNEPVFSSGGNYWIPLLLRKKIGMLKCFSQTKNVWLVIGSLAVRQVYINELLYDNKED